MRKEVEGKKLGRAEARPSGGDGDGDGDGGRGGGGVGEELD